MHVSKHAIKKYQQEIKAVPRYEVVNTLKNIQRKVLVERYQQYRTYHCPEGGFYTVEAPHLHPRQEGENAIITVLAALSIEEPRFKDEWTPAEEHFLRCHFGYMSSRRISKFLDRPLDSIFAHARRMGLIEQK